MSLFVGIDGGGSKTEIVVVDEYGQEIGRGFTADSNYQAMVNANRDNQAAAKLVAERLTQAVAQILLANSRPHIILAGLAGIDTPEDLALMQAALLATKNYPVGKWLVCNDAELILYGLTHSPGIGLGLIAGTGSIAVGRDRQGKSVRAGGWGHLIGDEGSGYALGRAALQAATQAADGRGPATSLLSRILEEWQLIRPEDLLNVVYGTGENRNQRIARLARLIFAEAQAGDEVAQQLVNAAIEDLAKAVWAVYNRLDFQTAVKPPALGLGGGLLLNTPELKTGILRFLQKLGYCPAEVVEVRDPAKAAALACIEKQSAVSNQVSAISYQ